MPWPFAAAPPAILSDTHAVPQELTALPGYPQAERSWPLKLRISSNGAAVQTYGAVDGTGKVIVPTRDVPPGASIPVELDFEPIDGLKEIASGPGLVSKAWGYTTS
jgi:hypothetical protein